jgi:S-DNA-T family DNA segregation ATPase FtsK/SpoIIIE
MKKNKKNPKNQSRRNSGSNFSTLEENVKKWGGGIIMLVMAFVLTLGFFDMAGVAGKALLALISYLTGSAAFALPVILLVGGIIFFTTHQERLAGQLSLAMFVLVLGICGILAVLDLESSGGGKLGYFMALPLFKLFGFWVALIIFSGFIALSCLMFWWLLGKPMPDFKSLDFGKEKGIVVKKKPMLDKTILAIPELKMKSISIQNGQNSKNPKKSAKEILAAKKFVPGLRQEIKYVAPPIDLLDTRKGVPLAGDLRQNAAMIKKTLGDFGIPVNMFDANVGPSVTQYTLKPDDGIKLSKITALSNDLSLALASQSIRIEAPIPGKALVGVEVPNKERAGIGLRELLASPEFIQTQANLPVCLGKDVIGNPILADLSRMPHLMVAGATGTGKTIFLNSLLTTLLYKNPPELLRLVLVDPKRVEMRAYNDLPHLLTPVIFDVHKTVAALKWAILEMDQRFDILGSKESRNIGSFNEKALKDGFEPMPYIVFVIDELADLMASKGKEVEAGIIRLAQMARAVGIHLVVATQRPSVEVITGLIKANITCRVAFQVASQFDSRTILDVSGAEKLLGAGDMLFTSAEYPKPKRVQGPYISEKEMKRVLEWIKEKNTMPEFRIEEGVLESMAMGNGNGNGDYNGTPGMFGVNDGSEDMGDDPLYEQAKKIILESRQASASFLQRRLRIGYARAARIIDIMEDKGVVGPKDGAKPREILVSGEAPAPSGDGEDDGNDNGWQRV